VATHAINPWLFSKLPYDPVRDFAPITLIAQFPNVLVMPPETAALYALNRCATWWEYARKNPAKLNYASGGNGSAATWRANCSSRWRTCRSCTFRTAGAAPAQLGMLAGQTDLMFDNLASAAPQIRAGKLRAFAVTSARARPRFQSCRRWPKPAGATSRVSKFRRGSASCTAGTAADIIAR